MYMRLPGNKKKAITFSYDDGVQPDFKLIDIFNKNGIRATFNLNASNLNRNNGWHYTSEQIENIFKNGAGREHEVAIHCYTHPFLDKLHRELQVYEVIKDREVLEREFGRIVRGCAYPMGTFSDTTVDVLRTCGIDYARTTVSTYDFKFPTDWLRMSATCHHNYEGLFDLADKFVNQSPYPPYSDDPWLFYVWGHSYEFNNDNNWDRIEKFCEKVGNRDDIWYATNIDIYDYVKAYNALRFSVECRIVHNPSSIPVWFNLDNKTDIKVEPGETLRL